MTGLLIGLDNLEQLPPDEWLTSEEGRRRFVTHQPTPPDFPDAAELAALTPRAQATLVQARRDYHSNLPLPHTWSCGNCWPPGVCWSSSTASRSPPGTA